MNTKEVIQARNDWLKSMLRGNMLKYKGKLEIEKNSLMEYHLFEDSTRCPLIHSWSSGKTKDYFWKGLPDNLVNEIRQQS